MIKLSDELKKYNKKSIDDVVDELASNPKLQSFIIQNDLTTSQIESSINAFVQYLDECDNCKNCVGLANCKNSNRGYLPKLEMYNNSVITTYSKCDYLTQKMKRDLCSENLNSLYMPKKVLEASFKDLYLIGEQRRAINLYLTRFLALHSKDEPMKGMYISGMYGVGKTYILAALAQELVKKGYKVMFAYYPDLSREFKSAMDKGTLEDMIKQLKEVDILMLDDIGGENINSYIRDEVLGPILQYRLLECLPTFFTSNYTIKRLTEIYRKDGSGDEQIKSHRIYVRLKDLTEEFELTDKPKLY